MTIELKLKLLNLRLFDVWEKNLKIFSQMVGFDGDLHWEKVIIPKSKDSSTGPFQKVPKTTLFPTSNVTASAVALHCVQWPFRHGTWTHQCHSLGNKVILSRGLLRDNDGS